jgi:uncharacterized coiled-coil protein SlyX
MTSSHGVQDVVDDACDAGVPDESIEVEVGLTTKKACETLNSVTTATALSAPISEARTDDDNAEEVLNNERNEASERRQADIETAKLADERECKIVSVRGLEAIINEQENHHTTLRDEIRHLQLVVTTLEIQKSSQEDEIETLKARIVKLELGLQMQDGTIASLQDALDTQSKCNDITINNLEVEYEKRIHEYKSYYKTKDQQIQLLQARVYDLEEERRKEKELASLEQQYI